MLDFLRNLTKSAAEKQQETIAAYLDDALSPAERRRFERQMAEDANLQAEVEQLRLVKTSLRQLPQRSVPRSFTLDPALYGRPQRQPLVQLYPALRAATALTAFFFLFALAAGLITGFGATPGAASEAAQSVETQADVVEVTRVVTEVETAGESTADEVEAEPPAAFSVEEVVEEETAEEAEEEMMEEAAEEPVEEVVAEEEMAEEEEVTAEAEATIMAPTRGETITSGNGAADEAAPSLTPLPTVYPVSPTPTTSQLPRVDTPTPVPDRVETDETIDELAEVDVDELAEPEPNIVDLTAVPTVEVGPRVEGAASPFNLLLWVQVGLGVLLVLLVTVTFYTRRQL